MSHNLDQAVGEAVAMCIFIHRSGVAIDPWSITKRPEPEPDLLCRHADGLVYFELANLCDPNIAEILSIGAKARQTFGWTSDPSEEIVKKHWSTSYQCGEYPAEFLAYTDGRIVTPDDVIIPIITPIFEATRSRFRRAWFMGEREVRMLWQRAYRGRKPSHWPA